MAVRTLGNAPATNEGQGAQGGSNNSARSVVFVANQSGSEADEGQRYDLSSYLEYFTDGKRLTGLRVGDVIRFLVDGEEHTITVMEIRPGVVVLLIQSTPQSVTLAVGRLATYDLNNDARADIQIILDQIVDDTATITFKHIKAPAKVNTVLSEDEILQRQQQYSWIVWLIGGILITVLAGLFMRRRLLNK